MSTYKEVIVRMTDDHKTILGTYDSVEQAAEDMDVSKSSINRAIKKGYRSAGCGWERRKIRVK